MNRARPFVSVLLGLLLLVQGTAVSAAPWARAADSASAGTQAEMAKPCHAMQDMQDMKGSAAGKQKPPCCDASCPDMTTCALGHLATVSLVSLVLPSPAPPVAVALTLPVSGWAPATLLRPPISSRG